MKITVAKLVMHQALEMLPWTRSVLHQKMIKICVEDINVNIMF